MNNLFVILFCSCLLLNSNSIVSQEVQIVKFDALENLMNRDSDRIDVINFWATWCKPCIKELPYFQDLDQQMDKEVNVTLISLDFADALDEKVIPFVKRRQLTPNVLLLDEIDYNSWIDRVDPSWSGAIPATLIINHKTGNRKFIEGAVEEGDIERIIQELSN